MSGLIVCLSVWLFVWLAGWLAACNSEGKKGPRASGLSYKLIGSSHVLWMAYLSRVRPRICHLL